MGPFPVSVYSFEEICYFRYFFYPFCCLLEMISFSSTTFESLTLQQIQKNKEILKVPEAKIAQIT